MRFFGSAFFASDRSRRNLGLALVVAAATLTGGLYLLSTIVRAQVVVPFPNFVTGTVADPAQVNANFSALSNQSLNRTGGTMTGTLTAQTITPAVDATYPFGDLTHRFTAGFFSGALSVGGAVTGGSLVTAGTTTLNGLTYTWPAAQTASYALTTNGSGTLSWTFPVAVQVTAIKVGTYTAAFGEFVPANGTFTVNLPAAAGNANRIIDVKNVGTGIITVDANASETIDGALTYPLSIQYQSVTMVCDGSNWYIR